MTRRERLMAILRGQPADRPAVNFYEIGGFAIDPSDPDPFNVYNDPSWRPLLQLAEEQTDLIRMRSPVKSRSHDVEQGDGEHESEGRNPEPSGGSVKAAGLGDGSAVSRHDHRQAALDDATRRYREEFFTIETYLENGCRFTRTVLKVAGRTMTALVRRSPEIDTLWTVEHLLKDLDDLRAYLELPEEVFTETARVDNLLKEDEELGERGIVMVDTEDPLCAAASLFSMEDFTIIALTEQRLFHRLLEKLSRHIYARTEKTARSFPGRLWRIYGPEYATEPYLPPRLFHEYVVRYTGPMVETIHKYGGFARIHCHGRLRAVLDSIVGMGADAIDPLEPPPHGDVELEYVRRRYGRDLALFGNIEIADLENTEPGRFAKIVEKALRDGTGGTGKGFVLMPSSAPNGRTITPTVMANYDTTVRLATQFGL